MSRNEFLEAPAATDALDVEASESDLLLQINLRLHLDEVVEVEAKELTIGNRLRPTRRQLSELAGKIYDARRARARVFDRRIMGEPAWDMLLALYCLPTRGELLTATSLSLAAETPQSTGHRWQLTLTELGLIERGPQGIDARKQFIRLTQEGRSLMENYLTRLFYCDTPVPPYPDAAGG